MFVGAAGGNPIQRSPPPKKKKPTEQVMNEPTANAPHCCPATRWDTEEAGCVFICDGRRRIIKTNSPPPKRKPNRNEEEEGGGSRWEGLLREHAAPACPSQGERGVGGGGGGGCQPPSNEAAAPSPLPPMHTVGKKPQGQRWWGLWERWWGVCTSSVPWG